MYKLNHRLCLPLLALCGSCGPLAFGRFVSDPAATHRIPSFAVPAVQRGVTYRRFMVIGDMGTGRPDQAEVAEAMARRAKQDGLDFWLTTGDNFYPNGVKSADDPQWETKFEDIYADQSLKVPVYPTLGNHDHRGSTEAQVERANYHRNWKMGGTHYTFTRTLDDDTTVQFFAIDTTPIQGNDGSAHAQLEWLDEELGRSEARWKIVFGHHPLYGHNPRRGHNRKMIRKLEPIFVEHNVDVYFAGHDHTLEMIKPIKGVHYVISGAGGGRDMAYGVQWTQESYYAATGGGFVYCRISKDELVIEFVRLDGATQYAHVLRK